MALRKPAKPTPPPQPDRAARPPDFKYRGPHGCQVSVWENKGQYGAVYSVKFQRNYYDEDKKEWIDTDYYRESDLLILAELARTVWGVINTARNEEEASKKADSQPSQDTPSF